MLFLLLLESWPDISSQSCGSVNTSLLLTLFPCVSSVSSPAWRRCSRHRVSTGAAAAMWHAQGLPPSLRLCLLVFLFLTHQPHPSLLKISVVLQHLATLSLLGFTPFSISHQRLLLSSSLSVFLFPQWNDWTLRWCTERCIDALNTVLMHWMPCWCTHGWYGSYRSLGSEGLWLCHVALSLIHPFHLAFQSISLPGHLELQTAAPGPISTDWRRENDSSCSSRGEHVEKLQ